LHNSLNLQPEFDFRDDGEIMKFNIGGQFFEIQVGVLTRDPFSILAALCRKSPPVCEDSNGIFFFDRDWWIFRHILNFLESNQLPRELETLRELYAEASFYRIESLQKSIEDIPVEQITQNVAP